MRKLDNRVNRFERSSTVGVGSGLSVCGAVFAAFMSSSAVHAACVPALGFGNGADNVVCDPGANEFLNTLGGNDTIDLRSGSINNSDMGNGSDTFLQSGGTAATLNQGSGSDTATISGGTLGTLNQGSFSDTLTVDGGTITTIDQSTGNDRATINSGIITTLDTGGGADTTIINGGTITTFDQGTSFDFATINGGHIINRFEDGDDVRFHGGRIGEVELGPANNIFIMDGTTGAVSVDRFVNAEQGADRFELRSGTIGTFVNTGSGNDIIIIDGTVIGTNLLTERGDDTVTLSSGAITGQALLGDDNDTFTWTGGLLGSLNAGDGSDTVTVQNPAYDGTTVLDGGDDAESGDGFVDNLTIANHNGTVTAAALLNWENVTFSGGKAILNGNALNVGDLMTEGLKLTNGAELTTSGNLNLSGSLSLAPGTTFHAAGAGVGRTMITNHVTNNGTISLVDGSAGDRFTVGQNYSSATGRVSLDTVLAGDNAQSDKLLVNGDTSGTTIVVIQNAGGPGAVTETGIPVIEVGGNSGGVFSLAGDYVAENGEQAVVGGAFGYTLNRSGKNWHLNSTLIDTRSGAISTEARYQPAIPLYEALPQMVARLAVLEPLRQRRARVGDQAPGTTTFGYGLETGERDADQGTLWFRTLNESAHIDPARSTSDTRFNTFRTSAQLGADSPVIDAADGDLIFGLAGRFDHMKSTIWSPFGSGGVSGIGGQARGTATWYSDSGFYTDLQVALGFMRLDINSQQLRDVESKGDAWYGAGSLETGYRFEISPETSLTPRAQVQFASVNIDPFTDAQQARYSLDDALQAHSRVGFVVEHELGGDDTLNVLAPNRVFANLDWLHDGSDLQSADVSGTAIETRFIRDAVEFGIGTETTSSAQGLTVFTSLKVGRAIDLDNNTVWAAARFGLRKRW